MDTSRGTECYVYGCNNILQLYPGSIDTGTAVVPPVVSSTGGAKNLVVLDPSKIAPMEVNKKLYYYLLVLNLVVPGSIL